MRYPYTRELDFSRVDTWAIGLVVNEGVRMNLSLEERVIAVREMKKLGMSQEDMAHRLRVSINEIECLTARIKRDKTKRVSA